MTDDIAAVVREAIRHATNAGDIQPLYEATLNRIEAEVRAALALAQGQTPAAYSFGDGIEAAARWHEETAAYFRAERRHRDDEPEGSARKHDLYAACIREIVDTHPFSAGAPEPSPRAS